MLLSGHGFTKPPPGSQLDRTHPLGRGLGARWPFWEGAGSRTADIARNTMDSLVGMPWTGSPGGFAVDGNENGDYINLAKTIDIPANADFSFYFRGYLDAYAVPVSGYGGFWRSTITSDGPTFCVVDNPQGRPWMRVNGVDVMLPGLDITLPLGRVFSCVYVWSSGVRASWYLDGALRYSVASATTTAAASIFKLGQAWDGAATIDGRWIDAGFWLRALTPTEVAQLAAEPYCMIRAPASRRWWVSTAVGGQQYDETSLAQTLLMLQSAAQTQGYGESVSQTIQLVQAAAEAQGYVEALDQVLLLEQLGRESQGYAEALLQTLLLVQTEHETQAYVESLAQTLQIAQALGDTQGYDETALGQIIYLTAALTESLGHAVSLWRRAIRLSENPVRTAAID